MVTSQLEVKQSAGVLGSYSSLCVPTHRGGGVSVEGWVYVSQRVRSKEDFGLYYLLQWRFGISFVAILCKTAVLIPKESIISLALSSEVRVWSWLWEDLRTRVLHGHSDRESRQQSHGSFLTSYAYRQRGDGRYQGFPRNVTVRTIFYAGNCKRDKDDGLPLTNGSMCPKYSRRRPVGTVDTEVSRQKGVT